MLAYYLKRGAYNTLFYGASSAITRAISFLLLPYFLTKLTLEEFGIWDFYQTFFSLGTLLACSCATTAMVRFYLLHQNDPIKKRQAVGNSIALALGSIILFLIATLVLAYCYKPGLMACNYFVYTLANVVLFACFSVVLAYLRMREFLWCYLFAFCGQTI
jgi:O-antigen/teichoic acid export membrane protein